jgi:microcystin-dependent protein
VQWKAFTPVYRVGPDRDTLAASPGARAMPIAGQIEMFAFGKVSDDWVPCNGQLLRGSDYWELLKLLQAAYGGEPPETFVVPNLPPPTPAGPFYFIYAGKWSGSHRGRRP